MDLSMRAIKFFPNMFVKGLWIMEVSRFGPTN